MRQLEKPDRRHLYAVHRPSAKIIPARSVSACATRHGTLLRFRHMIELAAAGEVIPPDSELPAPVPE